MYFSTNERLGETQPVCEAAQEKLERLETALKIFKKETEKTYPDSKRLKNLGALVVINAQNISDRLTAYLEEGCCEEQLKNLEAQVRALPWTFQKLSGSKIVKIERYGDIESAHRILIEAIRRAQQVARSHSRCAVL